MSLNWKEIDLVLSELELAGTHVQKIKQPDFKNLVFDLYRPGGSFSLLISLQPGATRIHKSTVKITSKTKPQRFVQLLRSVIKGGRITGAYQVGNERIIKVTVVRGGETTLLWVRLWSGAANIIATDENNIILDSFYRRPKRGETSGEYFDPEKSLPSQRKSDSDFYTIREIPGNGSFNKKIEEYYTKKQQDNEKAKLVEKAHLVFQKSENKALSKLEKLAKQKENYAETLNFKHYGDAIMASLNRIKPGDTWIGIPGTEDKDDELIIQLEPTLSGVQNAQKMYQKYKKAKSGLAFVEEEMRETEHEIEKVRNRFNRALESNDVGKIAIFIKETEKAKTELPVSDKEKTPGLAYVSGGFKIIIGRNAKENDTLLRKHVRGNDYWLHTRDYAGSYVFIKSIPGKSVPLEVLLDAGNLAVFHSKARPSGRADLFYTQVKYLRRPKEGKPGLVLPTQEKNLSITLDEKRLKRLHEETWGY